MSKAHIFSPVSMICLFHTSLMSASNRYWTLLLFSAVEFLSSTRKTLGNSSVFFYINSVIAMITNCDLVDFSALLTHQTLVETSAQCVTYSVRLWPWCSLKSTLQVLYVFFFIENLKFFSKIYFNTVYILLLSDNFC